MSKKNLFKISYRNSWYLKVMLLPLFFICQYKAYARPSPGPAVVFEKVKQTDAATRVQLAGDLYRINFRKADPATAMAALDQLHIIAMALDDKALECAIYEMRADYYSVNRGYNALSTSYYQQAVAFAVANHMQLQTGIYLTSLGRYQFIYKQYAQACFNFLRSQDIFREIGFSNVPQIPIYLSQFADFYYAVGDYDNARAILLTALKYTKKNSREEINFTNTIGLIYRNYKQYPMALTYFNNALKIARLTKDTVWVGLATGNIGSVYFLQGDYQRALPYIRADYNNALAYHDPVITIIALLRLVKINMAFNSYAAAAAQLRTAETMMGNPRIDLPYRANFYDLKSQLYEQTGRLKEAISYRKLFEKDKDSISARTNFTAVERVMISWETDKRITQLNKFKNDDKIRTIETYAGMAVLILLMVILGLLYNRQLMKTRKDKELLLAEKRGLDEELKNAGKALHEFTENLKHQNVVIENFRQEVERLNQESAVAANAGQLENLLQMHIMTDENWNDFRMLFAKAYPGFLINLTKTYPKLSATDTRLLTLIKLGLNNAEMANMLGITVEGIKKAKQRLRKKIDISSIGDIENDSV